MEISRLVLYIRDGLGIPLRIIRNAQLIQRANKSPTQTPVKLQDRRNVCRVLRYGGPQLRLRPIRHVQLFSCPFLVLLKNLVEGLPVKPRQSSIVTYGQYFLPYARPRYGRSAVLALTVVS